MNTEKTHRINSGLGVWFYHLEDDEFFASDETVAIFSHFLSDSKPLENLRQLQSVLSSCMAKVWLEQLEMVLCKGGQASCQFEMIINGKTKRVDASIMKINSHKGGKGFLIGTFHDTSWNRGTEEELVSTQILLKTILDYMPGPVYSKAIDGTYLYINKRFLESVNMRVKNPLGKKDEDIYDSVTAQSLRENDREVINSRKKQESTEFVPHPDGTLRTYESFKFPTFDVHENVQTVTGISFDITEKLKMKKELELERSRLIQTSKMTALGEMAGGIAHEINNPLAIIKGYTLRLKSLFFDDSSEKAKMTSRLIQEILKAIERTESIISSFRNFARDASREQFQNVSIEKILKDTETLCRARFAESQVLLKLECEEDLFVECQEVQISQVLLNLLGNALDATMENSLVEMEKPEVLVKAFAEGKGSERFVKIRVIDSGMGFSDEATQRFLEPFFSTKPRGKGTGLGMSISKSLVEKHHGTLTVSSKRNPTIVDIRLPMNQHLTTGESSAK